MTGKTGKDVLPAKIRRICLLGVVVVLLAACGMTGGCSIQEGSRTKVGDLEYEIVEDSALPEELLTMIEEKKAADFKLTYETEEDFYIVHGYGEQETGGYSICVKELYLTQNAVVFDTELIGPRKGENVSTSPSYPYIVIKTAHQDEKVIFE